MTFSVVSNPEFLREGSAIHDIFHPDRIVIGATDPTAAQRVAALYTELNAPVLITDPRSAEMIKYASNAFLATKISFINEVALICERLGADVRTVSHGMGLDRRIGERFLQAGAGFGGSCFPKDVRALSCMARDAQLNPNMLNAVLQINTAMRAHVIDLLIDHLGGLAGKHIAVLGLAYKANTNDTRESPAFDVIRLLLAEGATVTATDPAAGSSARANFPGVHVAEDPYGASVGADAVVIMTDWDDYRTLDLDHVANALRGHLIVDARGCVNADSAEAAGLAYAGIGYGAMASPPASPALAVGTGASRFESSAVSMAAD